MATKRLEKQEVKNLQQNAKALEKAVQIAEKSNEGLINRYGIGGLGALTGYLAKGTLGGAVGAAVGAGAKALFKGASNEIKVASQAFQEHPEIFNEYKNLLKDSAKNSAKVNLARLNQLGYKIESVQKEEKKQPIHGKRYRLSS